MSLALAHDKLGWPSPHEVRNPSGAGARIFAQLAHDKIEMALASRADALSVKVGVLARNSHAVETESPLAVVAEFQGKANDQLLRELHRLAWNFSHAPTVVTIEPELMRVWTCCEPPETDRFLTHYVVHQVSASDLGKTRPSDATRRAAQVLHWANLVSGQFFRDQPLRFRRDKRADQMLLDNLRHLRDVLRKAGLTNDDICHDLLARVIFVQFLFDRKDSSGNSALNANKLADLRETNVLKEQHQNFASILENYDDTYRLFDWLNERFNGDLFPGKGSTKQERERAWLEEKSHVKLRHLDRLRDFVRGDLDMPKDQRCLWPEYSFDAIPLEFISSIYEAFVTERARSEGIYYTPPHLVDFILDRVLPWGGDQWDLKVLDPACGSGIFLVKAFQRLIHRWKNSHPNENIRAETLRSLLERNLFGVDKDPHAVRVASFSLYLAMCDEIDPKHYWTQVHFPPMRQRRLMKADFFEETHPGFRTKDDAATYDLVVGNAPWGEELLTEAAKKWANEETRQWPVANRGIGTLFLPKAAVLTKRNGHVSMIQSASSLLFNRSGPACEFRRKFFTSFSVEEVVNLSALRFKVFNRKTHSAQKSVAPSCIVTFKPSGVLNQQFVYSSPKLAEDFADEFDVIVEPPDIKAVHTHDAANDAELWTCLMWGNQRDRAFLKRLATIPSLATLKAGDIIQVRNGLELEEHGRIHVGTKRRRFWNGDSFPNKTLLLLDEHAVLRTKGIPTHRKTDLDAFQAPQLIIKRGWQKGVGRFCAKAVLSPRVRKGVLFTQSYVSAHTTPENQAWLASACATLNSSFAVYFLLLTSSRFASYRPEPLVSEFLRVPLAFCADVGLQKLDSYDAVDRNVRSAFSFKDAEWVLVEDLFNVTLPDFKGVENSPGQQRTRRKVGVVEDPDLHHYCEYFIRVLKAGFGSDKAISATIFHENDKDLLPYRLVAFHLRKSANQPIRIQSFDSPELLEELEKLNATWLAQKTTRRGSIYSQRVARIYDESDESPTIYVLKPDAYRYWTRSMGLHDADEVTADLARWNAEAQRGTAALG
jgi:hypothetical protein